MSAKLLFLVFITSLSLMTSPPDGLSKEAWVLASIYLAAIIGLVSEPYPENSLFICIRWLHYPLWRRGRANYFLRLAITI